MARKRKSYDKKQFRLAGCARKFKILGIPAQWSVERVFSSAISESWLQSEWGDISELNDVQFDVHFVDKLLGFFECFSKFVFWLSR